MPLLFAILALYSLNAWLSSLSLMILSIYWHIYVNIYLYSFISVSPLLETKWWWYEPYLSIHCWIPSTWHRHRWLLVSICWMNQPINEHHQMQLRICGSNLYSFGINWLQFCLVCNKFKILCDEVSLRCAYTFKNTILLEQCKVFIQARL